MSNTPLDILERSIEGCHFSDPADALSPERVLVLRHELQALRDFASRHPVTTRPDIDAPLEELLELAADLAALLEAVRAADESVAFNRAARTFGAVAGLAGILEEFATGEDPLGEVLVGGVPYLLDRLSETAYIRSAGVAFRAALPAHTQRIIDRLWLLARGRSQNEDGAWSLGDSRRLGKPIAQLATALTGPALDERQRFVLHVLLYAVLVQAGADRLRHAVSAVRRRPSGG